MSTPRSFHAAPQSLPVGESTDDSELVDYSHEQARRLEESMDVDALLESGDVIFDDNDMLIFNGNVREDENFI